MSVESTLANPEEERAYLTKVKAELDCCETEADVLEIWKPYCLKVGHRKLDCLLIGRPLDEIVRARE